MHAGGQFGRYRILEALGTGTRGTAWLAEELDAPQRRVALKTMSSLAHDPGAGLRFVLETRPMSNLRHRCLLRIHAVDITEGVPWMAMEYCERGDLQRGFETEPLAWNEGLEVLEHVAAGLDHAHAHGVLHRDLRPGNLFRRADGTACVRLLQPPDRLIGGDAAGRAHWQAPEYALQRGFTSATDIYALGVIAFRWLAGEFPFKTTGTLDTLLHHVVTMPALERLSALPRAATDAIAQALEKDPARRFQRADEFVRALRAGMREAM